MLKDAIDNALSSLNSNLSKGATLYFLKQIQQVNYWDRVLSTKLFTDRNSRFLISVYKGCPRRPGGTIHLG